MSRKTSLINIHLAYSWQVIAVLVTFFIIIIVVEIIRN